MSGRNRIPMTSGVGMAFDITSLQGLEDTLEQVEDVSGSDCAKEGEEGAETEANDV
jgi:hypothetical protein